MHADEVFLARELELHRRARLLGEHCRDEIGVLVLVLVPEVAAHVLADDPHAIVGQAEIAGDVMAAVGDPAGRRVNRELFALPGCDGDARLHLRVVLEGGREAILERPLGRSQPVADVAASLDVGLRLVADVQREVAFGPNLDGVGRQRLFGLEHERQNFVVDQDLKERFFGDVTIHGGDRGHRIAHEPDRVVEGVAPLLGDPLDLVVVLLPAGNGARAPDDLAVLAREDRLDSRHGPRFGHVDRANPRVRMRAPQHARIQHPGKLHVAGVGRLARHPFHPVDLWCGMADGAQQAERRRCGRNG